MRVASVVIVPSVEISINRKPQIDVDEKFDLIIFSILIFGVSAIPDALG